MIHHVRSFALEEMGSQAGHTPRENRFQCTASIRRSTYFTPLSSPPPRQAAIFVDCKPSSLRCLHVDRILCDHIRIHGSDFRSLGQRKSPESFSNYIWFSWGRGSRFFVLNLFFVRSSVSFLTRRRSYQSLHLIARRLEIWSSMCLWSPSGIMYMGPQQSRCGA